MPRFHFIFLVARLIGVILFVHSVRDYFYGASNVLIRNSSGVDVRFEKVTVADQFISKQDEARPWLGDGRGLMLDSRGPRKSVELNVVILSKMKAEEIRSCTLDIRSPSPFLRSLPVRGGTHVSMGQKQQEKRPATEKRFAPKEEERCAGFQSGRLRLSGGHG
ncbi:MAG: hypothetical protein AB1733_18685 [Thermodesulfobacteriota bacterium]